MGQFFSFKNFGKGPIVKMTGARMELIVSLFVKITNMGAKDP